MHRKTFKRAYLLLAAHIQRQELKNRNIMNYIKIFLNVLLRCNIYSSRDPDPLSLYSNWFLYLRIEDSLFFFQQLTQIFILHISVFYAILFTKVYHLLTLHGARENTHRGARGLDRTSFSFFSLGPSKFSLNLQKLRNFRLKF